MAGGHVLYFFLWLSQQGTNTDGCVGADSFWCEQNTWTLGQRVGINGFRNRKDVLKTAAGARVKPTPLWWYQLLRLDQSK